MNQAVANNRNEMIGISIAKALKLKARLAGRLTVVTNDILKYNSVEEGQFSTFNVAEAYNLRNSIVEALISLKTAIATANLPILSKIYTLSEKKAELVMLTALPTTDGVKSSEYSTNSVTYKATYTKQKVDTLRRKLEREIDIIQDELDSFNHSTKLQVGEKMLTL